MLDPRRIQNVCAAHTGPDWWVHRAIPADRLKNAREHWKVPPEGEVIAFLDTTVFGSGKEGLAVLADRIVWNAGFTGQMQWEYPWMEFGAVAVRLFGNDLQIGRGVLTLAGMRMEKPELTACLRELQELAVAAGAPRATAFVPDGHAFPAAGRPSAGADELQRLVEELAGTWLLVAPGIPAKKLRNAWESMRIPPGETVIALADFTLFGSARDGLVVGSQGIYWRNSIVGGSDRGRMTWDELAAARVARAAGRVILSETDWVNPSVTVEDDAELFLLSLQWWARARMTPEARRAAIHAAGEVEPAPPVPGQGAPVWHLAAGGQQFGPYDGATVAAMAAGGQVNPDACFAWMPGMPDWLPLRQVPELAALLAPSPEPPAPPPTAAAASTPAQSVAPVESGESQTEDDERVDVNTAPVQDLLLLPGVTAEAAQLLVNERAARGGFRNVEQVGELLRLPPHRVERMRGMISFGRVAAPRGRMVDF